MSYVKVTLCNGIEWGIRPATKANIDIILNDLKKSSMDAVIVLCGPEGSGKSFNARGLAMYCATFLGQGTTFGPEDISFDINEYIDASLAFGNHEKGGPFKINVLDEARKVLNRRRSMSKDVVRFTNYLSECRAMRQVHILNVPAYHDLDRYIVNWRLNLMLKSDKEYKKGDDGMPVLVRGKYKLYADIDAIRYSYAFPYNYPFRIEDQGTWFGKEVFSDSQMKEYDDKKLKHTVLKYATPPEKSKSVAAEGGFVR